MGSNKVLIVDDDSDFLEVIEQYLLKEGYIVQTASLGDEAIFLVKEFNPDLILLDIMMPGLDGFETCQAIRKKTNVPILFLSAKEDDVDKILGLRIGGDDYITKPFNPRLLIEKIKAHLRRSLIYPDEAMKHNILEFPGLSIDMKSCVVKVQGNIVNLPAKEFQLLCILAKNIEQVFSAEQLFQQIWGETSYGDNRTVMVHISNLRKKIEPDPSNPIYILTVRRIGYKFSGYL